MLISFRGAPILLKVCFRIDVYFIYCHSNVEIVFIQRSASLQFSIWHSHLDQFSDHRQWRDVRVYIWFFHSALINRLCRAEKRLRITRMHAEKSSHHANKSKEYHKMRL